MSKCFHKAKSPLRDPMPTGDTPIHYFKYSKWYNYVKPKVDNKKRYFKRNFDKFLIINSQFPINHQ